MPGIKLSIGFNYASIEFDHKYLPKGDFDYIKIKCYKMDAVNKQARNNIVDDVCRNVSNNVMKCNCSILFDSSEYSLYIMTIKENYVTTEIFLKNIITSN